MSKHLEVRQKYSATHRIFNSLLGVWKCDETLSLVFDILHNLFLPPNDPTLPQIIDINFQFRFK